MHDYLAAKTTMRIQHLSVFMFEAYFLSSMRLTANLNDTFINAGSYPLTNQ